MAVNRECAGAGGQDSDVILCACDECIESYGQLRLGVNGTRDWA